MPTKSSIPPHLLREIEEGKVVLFLGAGASFGASHPKGEKPPLGAALGTLLSKRFLGGEHMDASLSQIGEYSINESDLTRVQTYIKTIFEPFGPSPAHLLLPQFVWKGLATTNYDLIVEKAYEACNSRLQSIQPFIENGDRVNDKMHDPKSLMFLKLHGCITRIQNPKCPLILTTDQYVAHRSGRDRIFSHLFDWGYEQSIVFVGYSLQDQDIRAIISELSSRDEDRPRYYLVAPNKGDIETRFWESKKVTTISATFADFMKELDSILSGSFRGLATATPAQQHPIAEKFAVPNASLSRNCLQFLANDVDYVRGLVNTAAIDPKEFYRGYSVGWSPIEQKLDARRTLGDTILADHFLVNEASKTSDLEVILIKAHAGAGKSILLKRVAWDAAKDYSKLCIFVRAEGKLNTVAIEEIATVCKERIFLFIDNVGDRTRELKALSRTIATSKLKVTVVAAERLNEWNVVGVNVGSLVTKEYELRYLNASETTVLIELLETYKSLGTLEPLTPAQRKSAFHDAAGRQLLVALHEATLGRPFEDIVQNEYEQLVPTEAQRLYLTVCVLNRLNVPVRAGIISRLHDVPFRKFEEKFFRPLEHVVHTIRDGITNDMMYVARHPVIAEIVFDRVLQRQEDRFEEYHRVLQSLNVDFASDRKAFREMTKGKTVFKLFPDTQLAKEIYSTATKMSADDVILFHQRAIYAMQCNELQRASEFLAQAAKLDPHNVTILHSRSELLLRQAEFARSPLERETMLREASTIAKQIKQGKSLESHAHHTLIKIGLNRLRALLKSADPNSVEIADIVKEIQKELTQGILEFPSDSFLLSADSELAVILNDSQRVVDSLEKAFQASPRAGFLAVRLATYFESSGQNQRANTILRQAIEANRTDRTLHYRYAKHLLAVDPSNSNELTYHLQRAFIDGDRNYDAQLLYARQLFITGDKEASRALFRKLQHARLGAETREAVVYPLSGLFRGSITRIEAPYVLVRLDGAGDQISAQRKNISDACWVQLTMGTHVRFQIGFNFYGAQADQMQIDELL